MLLDRKNFWEPAYVGQSLKMGKINSFHNKNVYIYIYIYFEGNLMIYQIRNQIIEFSVYVWSMSNYFETWCT